MFNIMFWNHKLIDSILISLFIAHLMSHIHSLHPDHTDGVITVEHVHLVLQKVIPDSPMAPHLILFTVDQNVNIHVTITEEAFHILPGLFSGVGGKDEWSPIFVEEGGHLSLSPAPVRAEEVAHLNQDKVRRWRMSLFELLI